MRIIGSREEAKLVWGREDLWKRAKAINPIRARRNHWTNAKGSSFWVAISRLISWIRYSCYEGKEFMCWKRHKMSPCGKVSQTGKGLAVYQADAEKGSMVAVTIAYAAMSLLTEQDLIRLRACQNSRCILLFYDTSKSATRHWCSIACTNRARSWQYYKRAKEASLL